MVNVHPLPIMYLYLCCSNVHRRLEKGDLQELRSSEMAASPVSWCYQEDDLLVSGSEVEFQLRSPALGDVTEPTAQEAYLNRSCAAFVSVTARPVLLIEFVVTVIKFPVSVQSVY